MSNSANRIRLTAAILSLLVACGGCLAACGDKGSSSSNGNNQTPSSITTPDGQAVPVSPGNAQESVTPETAPSTVEILSPAEGTYAAATTATIRLGDTPVVDGSGATVEGNTVTVTSSGTYLVSGTVADGRLVVNTADTAKVVLVLNGASLTSLSGPAVYVEAAPKKVVLYSAAGSVNLLTDGEGYVVPDAEQVEGQVYPNACVYACDDLELDGEGTLQIVGRADKGINTKDDLTVKGGTVTVQSTGVGIRANDSLTMSGGTVTVNADGDGVKTANVETEGKGQLTVSGGSLYVTARGDGLSAATDLTVSGGNLVVTTTDTDGVVLPEASGNPTGSTEGMGGFGGRPGGMGGEGNSSKSETSAKGLKATGDLLIQNGKLTLICQDDGLHANGNTSVAGGEIYIRSADDGIHADKELLITGGVLEVAQSYEGLEALHITVAGGTNRITASDDGANTSDGSGSGGMGGMPGGRPDMGGMPGSMPGSMPGGMPGGRPGRSSTTSTTTTNTADSPLLTFAGGYTVFNAGGDGIDSNGSIVMTGGTVLVYGPTDNGNGPIDVGDGNYSMTISGGTLLAVGSSGMAETAENAGQAVLAGSWNRSGLSAGETLGIVDSKGTVLAAFALPKAIASVVFSSPDLTAGESYTVVSGGQATGEAVDGVLDAATYTGYSEMGSIQAN